MHIDYSRTFPQRAFSLVELSIVLVILGLLIGGILSGQALIRAAELRSVSSEYNRYITSMYTFRDKYFQLPGDMTNATQFWQSAGGTGSDDACFGVVSTSAPTCNGNGNGQIYINGATTRPEIFRAWQHLANAQLVEGNYTGQAGGGSFEDTVAGTNAPRGKISGTAWHLSWIGNLSGDTAYYDGNYGNVLYFGNASAGGVSYGVTLKPEEAWNIDTKIDDGKPAYGRMVTFKFFSPGCATTTTSSTAEYAVGLTAVGCGLMFKTGF